MQTFTKTIEAKGEISDSFGKIYTYGKRYLDTKVKLVGMLGYSRLGIPAQSPVMAKQIICMMVKIIWNVSELIQFWILALKAIASSDEKASV